MFGIFKKKTPAPEQTIDLNDPIVEQRRKAFRETLAMNSRTFREQYEANFEPLHPSDAEHEARMEKVRRQLMTQMANLTRINTMTGGSINTMTGVSIKNPCSEIPAGSSSAVTIDPTRTLASQIVGDPPNSTNAFIANNIITSGSISASKIQAGSISDHAIDAVKYQFSNTTNQGEAIMAKNPISHEERERMMDVGRRIIELAKDMVFEVDGIPTLTVKLPDGQYRKKAMSPGWGFTLIDVYVGSRETPIFVLEPIDSLPFEVIEASIKEADATFPKLGGMIAEAGEITGTKTLGGVFGIIENDMRKQAKEAMVADQEAVASNPNWGRF